MNSPSSFAMKIKYETYDWMTNRLKETVVTIDYFLYDLFGDRYKGNRVGIEGRIERLEIVSRIFLTYMLTKEIPDDIFVELGEMLEGVGRNFEIVED